MKYVEVGDGQWFVRLEKGEEVVEQITKFAKKYDISGGFAQGIGGLQNAEIGVYRLSGSKDYEFQSFEGDLELVSLTGNIAVADNSPVLHIHCVVGNEQLQTVGGHLKSAVVGGTCEVYITKFRRPFTRQLDNETGLKLLSFDDEQ